MGNPPPGIEGQIYRELRRTRADAQGICVMNSAGKALAWTLSFDQDESVPEFFLHAKKLHAANPDRGVDTERYRRFPSAKMEDVPDDGKLLQFPTKHADGEACPGDLPVPPGAIRGNIVGRAFGKNEKPVANGRSQENYVEDVFIISKNSQEQLLAAATATAIGKTFELPKSLSYKFAENAYLGMLDVNPLGGDRVRAKLLEDEIRFTAVKQSDTRLVVSGTSRVKAKNREAASSAPGDAGRIWSHQVELTWKGVIDLNGKRVKEIALVAKGNEQLKWGVPGSAVSEDANENPVAHLLGGRPLDINTAVHYGLTAKH